MERNAFGLTDAAYELQDFDNDFDLPALTQGAIRQVVERAFTEPYQQHLVELLLNAALEQRRWCGITWPHVDLSISEMWRSRDGQFWWNLLVCICTLGFRYNFRCGIIRDWIWLMASTNYHRDQLSAAMKQLMRRKMIHHEMRAIDDKEVGIYFPPAWLVDRLSQHC